MTDVSFEISEADRALVERLVDRGVRFCRESKIKYPRQDMAMDLTACHANGCPMDFAKLLAADDFNFAHDLFGIRRHLNRETGELEHCFLPRAHASKKGA